MFDAMLQGLADLTPETLIWMAIGTILTSLIVVIPGLPGTLALIILLPFIYSVPREAALGMLVAAIAVNGTGNTVTGILFGIPGHPSGVAVTLDGYPLSKRGEGPRALAAAMTSSFVGGVLGAVWLAMLLPFLRPLALSFGPAEFFMLTAGALVFIAYIGESKPLKALLSAALGMLASFVGLQQTTGVERYTFDQIYLWGGLQLVPTMIGLFAISEMIHLLRRGGRISTQTSEMQVAKPASQIMRGVTEPFRHWRTTVRSSAIGMVIGVAPGLGGTAASLISYGDAARVGRKRGKRFGTGEIEGVIAADAPTNSEDGGALVPTLAFGIPGSSQMAILLVAMIAIGMQPGRALLEDDLDLVWMLIFILILANFLAAVFCIGLGALLSKVTTLPVGVLAPSILAFCLFGAYATTHNLGDVYTALAFGVLGYFMRRFGYSPASTAIGFVLGILIERNFILSMNLYGISFLQRPVVIVLMVMVVATVLSPIVGARLRRPSRDSETHR